VPGLLDTHPEKEVAADACPRKRKEQESEQLRDEIFNKLRPMTPQ
jgi:hypothetical protein